MAQYGSSQGHKRPFQQKGQKMSKQKKRKLEAPLSITGSNEEILEAELKLLGASEAASTTGTPALPAPFTEVEVNIEELSSTGDGLGRIEGLNRIFVVPFTVPGDRVTAKVIRHEDSPRRTTTDFVKVLQAGPGRDDTRINCRYFSKCSGCQLQMLSYDDQLKHKRRVVEDAYKHFSLLPAAAVPAVGDTIGSPMQYGYRTKLTPHFDGPPGARKGKGAARFKEVPPIGFMLKGTRKTLDIEECPIGTASVNLGMRRERARVERQLQEYKRGATILLRESTKRMSLEDTHGLEKAKNEETTIAEEKEDHTLVKSCISDHKGTSTEYVGDFIFRNPANAFFQNNNSILPRFIAYVRDHVLPKENSESDRKIANLIDAYSGSGLFSISLSSLFSRTIGIDISGESIDSAMANLKLNKLDEAKRDIKFLAGDASSLFESVPSDWSADETAVVIDPPRKGCDESFMRQLTSFNPARIVYVSCNVHTQARDVGWLLRGGRDPEAEVENGKVEDLGGAYEMESLRGFDFFPQTGHVESVAVLRRKKKGSADSASNPANGEADVDTEKDGGPAAAAST